MKTSARTVSNGPVTRRLMYKVLSILPGLLFALMPLAQGQEDPSVYHEFNVNVEASYRYFFEEGAYPMQERHYPGLGLTIEDYLEWQDGAQTINFEGFARLDIDRNRTHWDVRELYWSLYKSHWELHAGARKIFWGVTESVHLVDVINQTDALEGADGEDKLGQPMLHFSLVTSAGIFDLFYLPYHRKLQFPGKRGRFRTPVLLDADAVGYESGNAEWRPGAAFRWSHSAGAFDMGLSYFHGNGREPIFQIDQMTGAFNLFYPTNHQGGVDLQAVAGPWIFKWESIYRTNSFQDMFAFAGGIEYTISNIRESGVDLGIVSEYLFDNRDALAISGLNNDLFAAFRLAFNDIQSTTILAGAIIDLERSSKLFTLEASRRLGETMKLEIRSTFFSDISQEEFLSFFQQDDYLEVTFTRFF